MNLLLINPGRRDYLIKYFDILSKKYQLKIFLIDKEKNTASFAASKKTFNFISPAVKNKKKYIIFLRKFVSEKKINVIFPFSEWELKILADEKFYYKKKSVEVVVSGSKIINICQNKLLTIKFLQKNKILYPKLINFKHIKKHLPVIKKRVLGSGSKDQVIIKNLYDIPRENSKNFFLQKYLNCQEYGVDILNDLNGNYIHSSFKKKILMRAGDTDKAILVYSKCFEDFAKKISFALKHIGIIDVDFLFNGKKIFVLDINPRIGGGYPFTHEYGYNYLEFILSKIINNNKNIKFNIKKKNYNMFSKGISIYNHK
jgi:carbamoyl-phosphate synthase large subunit